MEDLSPDLLATLEITPSVSLIDLALALVTSAILNFALAWLYIRTHGGYSYSKSFVQSIVLVGLIVSLIMIVIGSEIARAFALVGAMSIVRFRTPLKDSRDLIFIFAAIAIGMAAGTGFYIYAAIFTGFLGAILLAFHVFKFGDLDHRSYVLKLRLAPADKDTISALCREHCRHFAVVSISRSSDDAAVEDVVYEIDLKSRISYGDFIEKIREKANPQSINLLVGEGSVNV
ncbi:DUF4956 domain-containing protein [Pelagibius litoralis]|uniref:DUF4956 domain-containing protein n=1 Tax=Pelagibius litoralis TaxID=374515 RepID=A0A967C489_9PROT|nr:DUF4956 domain-containing protein [Pelagibius litoralis]NIA68085.1 DUF4956 domain-containing protein [Pelagibius litoralis]